MKLYLSSFQLGNQAEKIFELMPKDNKKIAYCSNASDYPDVDEERRKKRDVINIRELEHLGLNVEVLNLQNYFKKKEQLKEKLDEFGGIFFSGGNTFILRQAMKLSGFDELFHKILKYREDFLYAGYSAGICVLAPELSGLQQVDHPDMFPYPQISETIWEGLGYLDYLILPHYKSDHPESSDIDKEVDYCERNNIKYKTLRDGEVIIIE